MLRRPIETTHILGKFTGPAGSKGVNLVKTPFELSARRPLRSSLGEETGVEDEDSGMLLHAACGKQDRGDSGASMPVTKRGSGLGDRSHGGEIAERRRPRPR